MTKPNEMYAYFTVHGEFDPAEITEVVRVSPTKAWRRGEKTANGHVRIFSRWLLYSTLARTERLEAHVADVLSQLDRSEAGFRRISSQYGGMIELVGYFWNEFPGLYLRIVSDGRDWPIRPCDGFRLLRPLFAPT